MVLAEATLRKRGRLPDLPPGPSIAYAGHRQAHQANLTPHLVQLQRVLQDGFLAGAARIQPLPQRGLAGCLCFGCRRRRSLLLLQFLQNTTANSGAR